MPNPFIEKGKVMVEADIFVSLRKYLITLGHDQWEIDICKRRNIVEQGGLTWNRFAEKQIKAGTHVHGGHVKCNSIFVYYCSDFEEIILFLHLPGP